MGVDRVVGQRQDAGDLDRRLALRRPAHDFELPHRERAGDHDPFGTPDPVEHLEGMKRDYGELVDLRLAKGRALAVEPQQEAGAVQRMERHYQGRQQSEATHQPGDRDGHVPVPLQAFQRQGAGQHRVQHHRRNRALDEETLAIELAHEAFRQGALDDQRRQVFVVVLRLRHQGDVGETEGLGGILQRGQDFRAGACSGQRAAERRLSPHCR